MAFTVAVLLSLTVMLQSVPSVMAEEDSEYEFTVIRGDDIETNPDAQEILEKIQIYWKKLAELEENKAVMTEHQMFIEEQRIVAEQKLADELESMYKKYEDFTPRAAFAKYVEKKPEFLHGFYWELFDYLETKVYYANIHKERIIEAGGSYHDAMTVFYEFAKFPKSELQQVFEDARVKHGIGGSVAGTMDADEPYPDEARELYESWMQDPTMHHFAQIDDPLSAIDGDILIGILTHPADEI